MRRLALEAKLEGTIAIVTGAASGIGAAMAQRLAVDGAAVVICDLNEAASADLARALAEAGYPAISAPADVRDLEQMRRVVDLTVRTFGGLTVLFNNAGISGSIPLDGITRERFDVVMSTNAYSVIAGTQAAVGVMRSAGYGKVINTCSIAGKRAFPGMALYAASKFAVRALTQSFAQELGADGIRVNAICPGMVDTPMWEAIGAERRAFGREGDPKALVSARDATIALRRHSVPADLVGLTSFLASKDSDYMTGQCLNIDGGMIYD